MTSLLSFDHKVLITAAQCLRESLPICWGKSSSTSCGSSRTWWGRWLCCTCQYHCPASHTILLQGAWEEELEEEAELAADGRSWRGDGPGGGCRDRCRWWRRSSCSTSAAAAGSANRNYGPLMSRSLQFRSVCWLWGDEENKLGTNGAKIILLATF